MKITRATRLQLRIQKIIFVVLLLSITGLLAWLSQQYSWQFDWTSSQRNTLSQSSIELLKSLDEPIAVNVFAQDDATVKAAIEEILNRYQREKSDFQFRIINPDINIELAQQDEVSQYGQVVMKYQGRKETITSLSEQAISSALQRLARSSQRKLVFLSGHGERDPVDTNNTGYSQLLGNLKSKGFYSVRHNLLEAPLPDDTDVLIIAAPSKTVLPGELEHITEYLMQGGNLLLMMDPDSTSSNLQGLSALTTLLHIDFLDGMIVDNNINLRQTLRIEHPAMIPVLDYYPHAITKTLDYNTLYPLSRGIVAQDNDEWRSTVIAQSLAQSWSESGELSEGIVFNNKDGDIAGPVVIVLAQERTLSSDVAATTKASQRVVITGDSDFLSNSYLGVGANLSLGTNIINWLSGDDDLIAVDIKNAPDTRLELNDLETLLISLGFLVVVPAGLVITGLVIWFKRRKR